MHELKSTSKESSFKASGEYESRLRRTSVYFLLACFIWALGFVFVDKALLYGWLNSVPLVLGAIVASTLLGLIAVWSYIKLLASMDELQQKVQFSAMAFSLGTTLVGSMAYLLLVAAGLIGASDVRDIITLLTCSYMAAVIYGQVKHR